MGDLLRSRDKPVLLGAAWTPLALEALESMLSRLRWQSLLGLSVVLALMILGDDRAVHATYVLGRRVHVRAVA